MLSRYHAIGFWVALRAARLIIIHARAGLCIYVQALRAAGRSLTAAAAGNGFAAPLISSKYWTAIIHRPPTAQTSHLSDAMQQQHSARLSVWSVCVWQGQWRRLCLTATRCLSVLPAECTRSSPRTCPACSS